LDGLPCFSVVEGVVPIIASQDAFPNVGEQHGDVWSKYLNEDGQTECRPNNTVPSLIELIKWPCEDIIFQIGQSCLSALEEAVVSKHE
jgi:hypothetical protein